MKVPPNPLSWPQINTHKFCEGICEEQKKLFTRRFQIVNFDWKSKSYFSKYKAEDLKNGKKTYDAMVEIKCGGKVMTRSEFMTHLRNYSNASELGITHSAIFEAEIERDTGFDVLEIPKDLSKFTTTALTGTTILVRHMPLVTSLYKYFSDSSFDSFRDLVVDLNNRNFKYTGEPIYIRSDDTVYLAFSFEETLKVVLTGSSTYFERDGKLYIKDVEERLANRSEQEFIARIRTLIGEPVRTDFSDIEPAMKSRADKARQVLSEFFANPFVQTGFRILRILLPVAVTSLGLAYAFSPQERVLPEMGWASDSEDLYLREVVKSNKTPKKNKRKPRKDDPDEDDQSVNLEMARDPYTNSSRKVKPVRVDPVRRGASHTESSRNKVKPLFSLDTPDKGKSAKSLFSEPVSKSPKSDTVVMPIKKESMYQHEKPGTSRAREKFVNLGMGGDPDNITGKPWYQIVEEEEVEFQSISDCVIDTTDPFFYKYLPFAYRCKKFTSLMEAILHFGFGQSKLDCLPMHYYKTFASCSTSHIPKDLDLAMFQAWNKLAKIESRRYICRGPNFRYCSYKGTGSNLIGRMLTTASGYKPPVTPESIADRPLMDTLRMAARSRVVVYSSNGSTYGLMVKGRYGIIPAHLCKFKTGHKLKIATRKGSYLGHVCSVSALKDVACFKVDSKEFPISKDITDWFVDKKMENPNQRTAILPIPYREDGNIPEGDCEAMLYPVRFNKQTVSAYQTGRDNKVSPYTMLVGAEYGTLLSQKGDCGLPLVMTKSKGCKRIFGIHVAASTQVGYACCVTTTDLNHLMMEAQMEPVSVPHPFTVARFTRKDHVVLAQKPTLWKFGIRRLGYGTKFESDEPFVYHASGKTQLYPYLKMVKKIRIMKQQLKLLQNLMLLLV